jgi:hypothetical protein
MFIRGRVGNLLGSLCLSILLLGLGQGAANAQTKLIKPLNGGTLRITRSGSYFLGANYVTLLGNLPVITVAVSNVTINLNGFSIISNATGGTAAIGISVANSSISGVTVVNGGIIGIRGTAIVLGSNGIASGLQLIGNKGDGVDCTSSCLVTNNVISGNTGTGLNFGTDTTSGYENNIIVPGLGGSTVTGGFNLGHNNCNGTGTCP